MTQDYIGRAEVRVKYLLEKIFDTIVFTQRPMHEILGREYLENHAPEMSEEFKRHKVDLWIPTKMLAVEVNFKHGDKANKKEDNFRRHLEATGHNLFTLDEKECPALFEEPHTNTWQDWQEIIQQLYWQKINEKGEKK